MESSSFEQRRTEEFERLQAAGFERAARSRQLRALVEMHRQPEETPGETLRRLLRMTMREPHDGAV